MRVLSAAPAGRATERVGPETEDSHEHKPPRRKDLGRGRHPRRYPHRRSCRSSRTPARRSRVQSRPQRLLPAAGLDELLRAGGRSRDRRHRLLRGRTVPVPPSPRHRSSRSRPAQPSNPPQGRQIRHRRRPGRCPGRALRPGRRYTQSRHRKSRSPPSVHRSPPVCTQSPHPGDPPGQRPDRHRPVLPA